MPKCLVLVTGVPTSGKSTFIEAMRREFQTKGVMASMVNDYLYFTEWAKAKEHRKLIEPVGETYDLVPEAYLSVSPYAASRLVEPVERGFQRGEQAVFVEAARGAYGVDNYFTHLLEPLVDSLNGRVDGLALVNYELAGPSREALVERGRRRVALDPEAPPAEVPLKYFSPEGMTFTSSVAEFARSPLAPSFLINERVENFGDFDSLNTVVNERFLHLARALGLPPTSVEGQAIGSERL